MPSYSAIAPGVFERLGAEVTALANAPDGTNINAGCGATDLAMLRSAVGVGGYDLGIAFDGDGDRMLAVDASGAVVDGDQILAICALALGVELVVVTTMTNMGFHRLMADNGIRVVTTDVERAFEEASRADEVARRGWGQGPLHGVPITIKDSWATAGMRTTSGAPELADYVPPVWTPPEEETSSPLAEQAPTTTPSLDHDTGPEVRAAFHRMDSVPTPPEEDDGDGDGAEGEEGVPLPEVEELPSPGTESSQESTARPATSSGEQLRKRPMMLKPPRPPLPDFESGPPSRRVRSEPLRPED